MGFHDHPTKVLGKRSAAPYGSSEQPAILASRHFMNVSYIPNMPASDSIQDSFDWPMDRNDSAGDCVVAGSDHLLQVIYGQLGIARTNWTDAQLLKFYQTQNPGFKSWADSGGPHDNGMSIQKFLAYLVKQGYILGFARLDHTDETTMRAATWLGLGILTGQMMQEAQQNQDQVWDYVPNSPDWGGHCTVSVGYLENSDMEWVSWGNVYDVTPAFISHQMDEAWMVITQAHIDDATFRAGFNLESFGKEFTALTGRPFPYQPTPTPNPQPQPDAGLIMANTAFLQASLDLGNAFTAVEAAYLKFANARDKWTTAWKVGMRPGAETGQENSE